jgi:2-oxoglutarate/2-oxoacid ferredoxin oxidoreductase subunit beta
MNADGLHSDLLRQDRLPHIWCPGCGVGISLNCFLRAVERSGISSEQLHVVSGIGCTGRVAGYVNVDSFHTTHGRALSFATGLALSRPSSRVVVYSGDGDLTAIGGNHLIHSARRNIEMTVICVNNYTYGMTGGQVTPTTPDGAVASTTPYGNYEHTFSLPGLVEASGATFVSRWTTFHVRHLIRSMAKALTHPGFAFIEILSPCPTLFMRRNRMGAALAMMETFRQTAEIRNGNGTAGTELVDGRMVIGDFLEVRKPTFRECYDRRMREVLGEAYVPYAGTP